MRFGWYEVLYAALQPLRCSVSSSLRSHFCTTFLRRRRRRKLEQREFRWLQRRRLPRLFWWIEFFSEFRRRPQLGWFGLQFERAQLGRRIVVTRFQWAQLRWIIVAGIDWAQLEWAQFDCDTRIDPPRR